MATKIKETSERGLHDAGTQRSSAPSLDQPKPESIRPLVLKALEDAADDQQRAAGLLIERILADKDLFRQHLGRIVQTWASDQVRTILTERRVRIVQIAESSERQQRLEHSMSNDLTRLMDTPLYGGKRLGQATAAEVRESAAKYALLAKTNSKQAKWQEAVAAAAEKNGTSEAPVGQVLSEATLNKLWEEANAE